jgi:multiple sugar transport system permease protein
VSDRARSAVLHAVLVAGAAATLFPLYWMLAASLMPQGEASAIPPRLVPSRPTLEHYVALFSRLEIGRVLLNSVVIALAVTVVSVFLNALAGWSLAKLRFPGRRRLFALLLAAMVVPGQVAMLPLFLLLRSLGLVNTIGGVVVPAAASLFGIFLIRQYALSVPDELLDAARVEGAGELKIFWRIGVPLCKPALVTLALFTCVGTWSDFMWPLVVLTDQKKYTLPVALANLSGEHALDVELMMAGAVVTVLPVLLLFLFLQRAYIAGITMGGVKE